MGWSNHIIIKAFDKKNNEKKIIIDRVFNDKFTEYEDYGIFSDKNIFHVRISDFEYNNPVIGFNVKDKINNNNNKILEQKN